VYVSQGMCGPGPLLVLLVDLLLAWLLTWLLAWLLLLLLLLEPFQLLLVHDLIPQGPSSHVLQAQPQSVVWQCQGHNVCVHHLWTFMAHACDAPDTSKLVRALQAATSQ
jgi:hypothetical protein